MAKAMETAIPVRLRDRHRRAQLASDRRAGTHSRREVRALQRRWLRRHWMPIVLVAVLAIVMAGFINVFVWQPAAPYAIGALLASAAWWVYTMMLETGGIAPKRSGITAEEWTADELRKLRKGWSVVNHVMLVNSDVDHVLLGPGGFLAVETKFRSDWGNGMQNLESMARTAHNSAHDVASRLRLKTRRVQPLVVMWGPDIRTHFPAILGLDGVTYCPGYLLREYVRTLPAQVEPAEVQTAFKYLDGYVKRRDEGEVQTSGPLPRTGSQVTNDLFAVMAAVIASSLAVLAPAALPPAGLWSVAAAAGGVTAAALVRRRLSESPRVRVVTTAVITTCSGLGALLSVVAGIQFFG